MIKITNDTSTLNGSLLEMKDQLLTELSNKGVTTSFDPTTGLLGLISEISNIPSGGGATVDSLTLTSDKSILSYADSQSATLTVTAYDSSNNPVPNASVGLYKNGTYWDTITTNNNGVATKTYNSTGAGDINITAISSITYQTILIEDCSRYNNTNINSVIEVNYPLPSGDWSIEFDSYKTSESTSNNQCHVDLGVVANRITYGQTTGSGDCNIIEVHNSSVAQSITNGSVTLNEVITHKLEFINGIYYYTNPNGTVNLTPQYITNPTEITTLRVGSYNRLNNLKIKPMSGGRAIRLTSNKSTLSYVDSESATLTVTHPKGAGYSVALYNATTGTKIGDMTDNNDGTYSYTYNSAGVGDISMTAVQGNNESNSITITDASFYDDCSTNKVSAYTRRLGSSSISYDNNGYLTTTEGSSEGWLVFSPVDALSTNTDWCIEAKIKQTNYPNSLYHSLNLVQKTNSSNHISLCLYSSNFASYGYGSPNTYLISPDSSVTSTGGNWYRLKCELQNGTIYITIYDNSDVQIYSNSVSLPSNYQNIEVYPCFGGYYGGTTRQYKNILVKPL